jgi:protein DGCR14
MEIAINNLSLNQFQARYTSEDNQSFTQVLRETNEKRMRQVNWMFEASIRAKNVLPPPPPCILPQDGLHLTEAIETLEPKESNTNTSALHNSQVLSSNIDSVSVDFKKLDPVDKLRNVLPSADARPGLIPTWPFVARNSFMFPPDVAPKKITTAFKGSVHTEGTRFPRSTPLAEFSDSVVGPENIQASRAIDKIVSSPFSLVSMTPIPHQTLPPPEMTWGELEATPVVIRDEESEKLMRGFRVPDTPRRELLGAAIGERLRRGPGSGQATTAGTPSRTPSAASSALAKKLLQSAGGVDSQLRASYRRARAGGKAPSEWSARTSRTMTPFSFVATPTDHK